MPPRGGRGSRRTRSATCASTRRRRASSTAGWSASSASVSDPPLRERLLIAIDGKGAFRRFKDVLLAFPAERERWFAYRSELLHFHIQTWLDHMKIEVANAPPWGHVAQPAEPVEIPRAGPVGRGAGRDPAPPGARSARRDPGGRAAVGARVPRVPARSRRRARCCGAGSRDVAGATRSTTTTTTTTADDPSRRRRALRPSPRVSRSAPRASAFGGVGSAQPSAAGFSAAARRGRRPDPAVAQALGRVALGRAPRGSVQPSRAHRKPVNAQITASNR